YQAAMFDEQVHALIERELLVWRELVATKLRETMEQRPPRLDVSADELADGLVAAIEGGFVLARGLRDAALLPGQLRQFRNYLELLFGAEAPAQTSHCRSSAAHPRRCAAECVAPVPLCPVAQCV